MTAFFWNVALAVVWVFLTGSFSAQSLLFGFVLGYAALAILQYQVPILHGYARRLPRFFMFLMFFIKELIKANLRIAFDILTPLWHMQPGVIALPIQAKTDLEITMLSNFIGLTPGTLSLDISNDRRVLYIHAMFVRDEPALLAELQELERRILEVMR